MTLFSAEAIVLAGIGLLLLAIISHFAVERLHRRRQKRLTLEKQEIAEWLRIEVPKLVTKALRNNAPPPGGDS